MCGCVIRILPDGPFGFFRQGQECHHVAGGHGGVARDASQMYANNLFNLVEDTWDTDAKTFVLDMENDILPGCVITHGGEVVHPTIKNLMEGEG